MLIRWGFRFMNERVERNFGDWEGMSMNEVQEQFPEDYVAWEQF